MVCDRCIKVIKIEFSKLKVAIKSVSLGEVVLDGTGDSINKIELKKRLQDLGFDILDDKKEQIIERIKTIVIAQINYSKGQRGNYNFSYYLQESLGMDYSYLSSLFSAAAGTTIEKYIIQQKIERVKELLVYNEMNLNEIAFEMEYSSVQHLSTQFKKVTGFTPSSFKKMKENKRKALDEI